MFVPANVWFCCLRDEDKAAVVGTAALFTSSLMQPVPAAAFDVFWAATMLMLNGQRDAILTLYGLEDTFIVIPDEPPVPAVGVVNVPLWLDVEGFVLTGQADCVDGCDEPRWNR